MATHIRLARVTRELAQEKHSLEGRVRERTAQLEATARALRAEVDAHQRAEAQLRITSSAFESSPSSMFITDAAGQLVAVNPAFVTVTGHMAQEAIGRPLDFLHAPDKLHDDLPQAIAILHQLKSLGVALTLDRYRGGVLPGDVLTRLPLDRLKIDPAVLSQLGGQTAQQTATQAIVDLAQSLDLVTVANGIE